MPNGKSGAFGPSAQPPVAKGSKFGPGDATVTQLLTEMISVLEILQKLKLARHPSVKVILCAFNLQMNRLPKTDHYWGLGGSEGQMGKNMNFGLFLYPS